MEKYSVKSSAPITAAFGNWTDSQRIIIEQPEKWERRTNLRGATIVNGLLYLQAYNTFQIDENGNIKGLKGPSISMLQYLASNLNFTIENVLPRDGQWGLVGSDGKTWTGLVLDLMEGHIDISVAGLTQTLDRNEVIDFSVPLARDYVTLISAIRKGPSTQFWVYLEIFPKVTWIVICMQALLLILAFSVVLCLTKSEYSNPVLQGFAVVFLQLMQLDCTLTPQQLSTKTLFMTCSFFAYLIFTFYTCDLTARMTSGSADSPIGSFQDVLDRGYQVTVTNSSASEELLKSSPKGSAISTVYLTTMRGNPKAYMKGGPYSLARLLKEPKTLYFSSAKRVQGSTKYTALNIKEKIITYDGWTFAKGSELTPLFNYHLFKMEENGVKAKIFRV